MRAGLPVAALLLICACTSGAAGGNGGGSGGGAGLGHVSGRLTVFGATSASAPHVTPARVDLPISQMFHSQQRLTPKPPPRSTTEWIAGQIIVRLEERTPAAAALARLKLTGVRFKHGGFASEFLHLLRATATDGKPLTIAQTHEVAQQLQKLPGVRFAEVNQWQHKLAVPNDKLFPAQWHYTALNLPAAWDITTGSASIVIADVDTGIVPHPDLDGRVVPGIDMIDDATNAGDGDGRDDDPLDPGGDEPNGGSSWHGTHTAGTIGAVTNNDYGIAGVDWAAKLLPVRVLGKKGGTLFDIAAGIAWATGATVPGSRANPNPAVVVNLSLGGASDPSPAYQDVIDTANAKGAIFSVAAGNSNEDALRTIPCIQQGVICVGATRFAGTRASYSNFGAAVTVMAPGGEVSEDANGDTYPDGVLSTFRDAMNAPIFYFSQGTSMAAPHVTGVLGLMKAVNGALTFAQARQDLVMTANPDSKCNEGCGAGLVNAQGAVLAAKGAPPTGPARLAAATTDLLFSRATPKLTINLSNLGAQPLTINATAGGPASGALSFPSGSGLLLPAGASGGIVIAASFLGLPDGTSAAQVDLASNGGDLTVNVKLKVGGAPGKPGNVGLFYRDAMGMVRVAAAASAPAENGYAYSVDVAPGKYFVVGVIDENGDNDYEEGEPIGFYPTMDSAEQIDVTAGGTLSDLNFPLAPIKPACATNADCGPGGSCNGSTGYCL